MARYSIEDTTLTAIGDAMRGKIVPATKNVNNASGQLKISCLGDGSPSYNWIDIVETNNNVEKIKIKFISLTMPDTSMSVINWIGINDTHITDTFKVGGEYVIDMPNAIKYTFCIEWGGEGYCELIFQYTFLDANNNEINVSRVVDTVLTPLEMASEINAFTPSFDTSKLNFTGDCDYAFYKGVWDWVIENYGNSITTTDLGNTANMFDSSTHLTHIPFEFNYKTPTNTTLGTYMHDLSNMFRLCQNLEEVPKFNNCYPKNMTSMFTTCKMLLSIPEDFESWFDWTYFDNNVYADMSGIFRACKSLRSFPVNIFNHAPKTTSSYQMPVYNAFVTCVCLDEIVGLPLSCTEALTSNIFIDTFKDVGRVKNITFALSEDGTPLVKNWKNQTIDLTQYVGYCRSYETPTSGGLNMKHGITDAHKVVDDASYDKLKNDPNWWTTDLSYSRYNHDSAVATINSLPDTTSGGTTRTNIIKFKSESGKYTDGGAINTLTEEEIAVAIARGWTVTYG